MNSRTTAERSAPPAPINAVALLDEVRADITPLLAENGQSFDRLRSTLTIAVQQEPKILLCSPESLRREISKCAADGLVPDSKEAVLLPYYDNKEKCFVANYQPMVHGIIKRLRELGGVFSIVCNLVYEGDEFIVNEADPDSLVHKTDRFSKDRGGIVGGYAIFRDDLKRVMHLEIMSLEDFESVRRASKAPDSPAWKIWKPEMYRKAVLRRGSKYISTNNDKIRALLERDDSMFDFSQPRAVERVDPFSGKIIDGEATELGSNSAPAASHQQPHAARTTAPETSHRQQEQQREDEQKQPERPPAPTDLPDLSVAPMDVEKIVEGVTSILAIALDSEITAKQRQGNLKEAATTWKGSAPDYLHPLLKACIDITDWSIKCDSSGLPWAADHAMFVHKVKALLGVEKLNIGRYP